MNADELLELGPFDLSPGEKNGLFLNAMRKAAIFHYDNCEPYQRFCKKRGFKPNSDFALPDIPLLPIEVFKEIGLLSVPKESIVKMLRSSSTTGKPSAIPLDNITARRQTKALISIMSSFTGQSRKIFVVLDDAATVKEQSGELSSRGTAIRSMMPFARKMYFILDDKMHPDMERLEQVAASLDSRETEICIFGFTYLVYNFMKSNQENERLRSVFSRFQNPILLHIGGWKKLADLNVDKQLFADMVSEFFHTEKRNVLDLYGMTEQLGIVYVDCEYGFKHVPVYSEIIVRNISTLEPAAVGEEGFIQLLSPIPHSYPGISILSDDIGVVVKEDGCKCGRRGKMLLFKRRAEKAEIKGCGDTLRFE